MSRLQVLMCVRHAPTDSAGRCIGRTQVPVAIDHQTAAETVRSQLRDAPLLDWRPEVIWSSPLPRCAGLARELGKLMEVPCQLDDRLLEISHGGYEGWSWDRIEKEAPDVLARWMEHYEREGLPGGESANDVEKRVRHFLDEVQVTTALLVGHAGVLRSLRVIVDGLSWPEAMAESVPHLQIRRHDR